MSQGDLVVANATGLAFRQDLNAQLLALGTLQSGASAPSTTYAYMLWADTANDALKIRSAADDAWIVLRSLSGTGYIDLPTGTTGERPGTADSGMVRFNSTLSQFEGYNGTSWGQLGGGATGGGSDTVFIENGNTVTTNYTLTTGKNAVSAGPVTIDAGVTVTVPSGQSWVVV